jgi:hypothetical protein
MHHPNTATFTLAFILASAAAALFASPEVGILGSITNPSSGNGNLFKRNGESNSNSNGIGNGNDNSAGDGNGNKTQLAIETSSIWLALSSALLPTHRLAI